MRPAAASAGMLDPRAALWKVLFSLVALSLAHTACALDSVLPLDNPADAAGAGLGVFAGFRYFVGNDPLSVHQYQKDWQGNYHPRNGLNIGLNSIRAEVGTQVGGWRLSAVQRTELLIESGREMTDLIRLYKTRQPAPPGQAYDVDLTYAGYKARGWRIDKAWRMMTGAGHKVGIGLGYSFLEGNRVRVGSAEGALASQGGGDYAYAVKMNDAYSGKTYPFQTPGSPGGGGGSVDIGLDWSLPQGGHLEWIANDLLGRMRWRDVPGTVANAGTGLTSTDPNGYIVYAPALSGRNARRDFVQKLPVRWGLGAELPWRDFYALGSLSHLQHTFFPLLGIGWKFLDGWRIQADYDLRLRTYGLKLAGKRAFITVRTSQRNLSEAQAYGVYAGASWMF